jgi:hypothetical protein
VLLQLINMKDPQVGEIIMHPENASFVAELIGMPDLYIPGDDSRNKQLYEIAIMLQAQPTDMGINPMTGQEQFQSSVPIDPDVDNHGVEAEVCLAWLNGDVGIATKEQNPAAWMNVRAHFMEHQQVIQMQMAQAAQMQAQQAAQGQKPPSSSKSGSSSGPGDVSNPEPQAQSA